MDEEMDFDEENELHKDSHNLTPNYSYNPKEKESKSKNFISALKTRLSPRAKSKSIHSKLSDETIHDHENREDTNSPTEESPKSKSPKQKSNLNFVIIYKIGIKNQIF